MDIEESDFLDMASSATSRFELWINILNVTHARTILEVGVWRGKFAKEVLEHCKEIEKYYMIDPWARLPDWNKPLNVDPRMFDDVYSEAMRKTEFASEKRIVLRGRTKEVIGEIPDESLDFAYIDGDHTLRGITIDLIKTLPKIKINGFIAGDDFSVNVWQHDTGYEPTLVCPFSIYFAEAMGLPIIALPFNQFAIQKKINPMFSFRDPTGKYGDVALNKLPVKSESFLIEVMKKFKKRISILK